MLIPWVLIPGMNLLDQTRTPKNCFFDLMCLGMIGIAFHQGIKFVYKNKYIAYFFWYFAFTAAWNWYFPLAYSINKVFRFNIWTVSPMIHVILATVLSYIALSTFERKDYDKIGKALCVSSVLINAFGLLQMFNLDPWGGRITYNEPNHYLAFLDHYTIVGAYLAICIPFFLHFKGVWYKAGLLFCMFGLFVADATTALFSSFIGIFVYLILRYRKSKKVVISTVLIIMAILGFMAFNPKINHTENGFNGRLMIWERTFEHIKQNPLWGSGVGVMKSWGVTTKQRVVLEAHNDYIEIMAQFGLVGVILFGLVIYNAYRKFNYHQDNHLGFAYLAGLTVFLVMCTSYFLMELSALALLGLVCFWGVEKL